MVMRIKKRNGAIVPFQEEKISVAVNKAFKSVYGLDYKSTSDNIAAEVKKELVEKGVNTPDVEQVQDLVEVALMRDGHYAVAKAYVLYRDRRTTIRDTKSDLMKTYQEITFSDAKDSDVKRENANVDGNTAMGTMLKYGSEGSKMFFTDYITERRFAEAHKNGDIHIHDMDFAPMGTTTCTQIDLLKLFKDGFGTGHGHLREPQDIASYSALGCIAIQSNQNDQHGGQSVVNFDYAMAEGLRKSYKKFYRQNLAKALEMFCGVEDKMSEIKELSKQIEAEFGFYPMMAGGENDPKITCYLEKERGMLKSKYGLNDNQIDKCQKFASKYALKEADRASYQAMEAFIHNLNTMHSRAGAQTPFSSINYGMDTSPEARMVIKNLLLTTEAGLGNGETPIFPIQIFRVKEGVNYNPGEPNYDLFKLAIRCSAKRLFPNFAFVDAPFNLQYYKPGHPETEIAYMGCRTRVIGNTYDPSREICNGRGNLSFTTINLPRIAIEAKGDWGKFYDDLDAKMDLCVDQLLERFEFQMHKKVMNAPFLMGQGVWIDSDKLDWNDELGNILKHGTLSVGFIGLAETLKVMLGVHHGESDEAQKVGLEIIEHMRKRMDDESKKRTLNFSLLATPAEGLSGRFTRIDRLKYGVIPGVTDRDYYTNSFHVPVYYPISAFDKIQKEAPYHALTNAGHISYIEMDGDPTENLEAFEKVIRCMKEAGIGYGSVNHPVDRDPVCGFSGIIGDQCPACGRRAADDGVAFERIRRITGYLVGDLTRFNNAKRAEVTDRVKHST